MSDVVVLRDDTAAEAFVVPSGAPGIKGDPGGNVMAIGLFTAASGLTIPTGTNAVRTSGYSSVGVGIADYVADAAVNSAYVSANPRTSFMSANSRGFRLVAPLGVSPEMLGAVGSGSADDYAALTALAAWLSGSNAAIVDFAQGKTYYVGQYHTASNGVNPITIANTRGLILNGNGATIAFKGDFDRTVSTTAGIGLVFTACSYLRVYNLELNGNVQNTTNSSGSVESPYPYGINLQGCTDVEFANVYSHHFATDGMILTYAGSSPSIASKRLTFTNCRFAFNARQGVTFDAFERATFINCEFTDQWRFAGTYTHHAPGSGIDIEPQKDASYVGGLDVDSNNLHFVNCRWRNNGGSDILGVLDRSAHTVTFDQARVESSSDASSVSTINIGLPRSAFRNSYIDLAGHRMELSPGSGSTATHIVENNEIRGTATNGSTFYSGISCPLVARNNRFVCTAAAALANNFIALTQAKAIFEDNYVFVPAAAYADGGATDGSAIAPVALQNIRRAARNRYETDLAASAGSSGAAHFYNFSYGTTPVKDERFIGTAAGTADTFRPSNGSVFDTNFTYSLNDGYAGHPGFGTLTDASLTLATGSKRVQRLDVPITAARTITLPAPGNQGRRFRFVRTSNATGAFNININTSGGTTLKQLTAASTWAEVEDDGTQYRLIGAGSL